MPKKLKPSVTVGITVGTSNHTGATCVNIINASITNIMTRLLRAAIGLSLSALSLAWFIESLRACKFCIISFCCSCAAWLLSANNLATKPNAMGATLVKNAIILLTSLPL